MKNARDTQFSGDFSEVKAFYAGLRRRLYNKMVQNYGQFIASPISYNDCLMADSWKRIEPQKRNDWRWSDAYNAYQKSFKRFDIAFKQGGKLVSLSYGIPTAHKTGLKVELIESTPFKEDKLGIPSFEVVAFAAQIYAFMLGADEVRIMKPTSPESRAHYCSFGYEYINNKHKPSLPDYCALRIK